MLLELMLLYIINILKLEENVSLINNQWLIVINYKRKGVTDHKQYWLGRMSNGTR